MGTLSPWHWAIVAIVVLILFGSKKLPDAARGLGRSLRIFKSEMKEMQSDENPQQLEQNQPSSANTAYPPQQVPPVQQAPVQHVPPQQMPVNPVASAPQGPVPSSAETRANEQGWDTSRQPHQ